MSKLTSIEICAGAGGQALGLEQAGFDHQVLWELDPDACWTLRANRPQWNIIKADIRKVSAAEYEGVDLLAGGVPCPPFSIAGRQLGKDDERDLFPKALELAQECNPKAIMLENVRGLVSAKFEGYRDKILDDVEAMGFVGEWRLLNASDFGVPQLRPRAIFVALKESYWKNFEWPEASSTPPPTVGQALVDEMGKNGWHKAKEWSRVACSIAPTLVGGSKKHGGPDLGPTRAKRSWAKLGVNAHSLAEEPPNNGFEDMPRLTVKMAAILQGFPYEWEFQGKKTSAYRQVGNAFPPPVAKAVGLAIAAALKKKKRISKGKKTIKNGIQTKTLKPTRQIPLKLANR